MVIRVPDQRSTRGGYTALDDRMLVLDFQAGNPQAFVEIHHRYGGLARHVCQRFLPNRQDADEAFQETMIRVFKGLYRFNGRYALQPWIARIAKNVSLDILRGRATRPQTDELAPSSDELPKPGDEADEIVDRLVARDTVLAVLAELPEAHRQALMLREIEGQSHREIAQEMEITPGQAKALIHRAKGSFRKRWLEKSAERGGLMGIAFLPLVWLLKLTEVARRVGDRAGHAAQAAQMAAPDAVTSTVSAGAAPAASGIGERLIAAGVTILVAGSVTVGAAKIVNDRARPESVAAAVANVASEVDLPPEEPEPPVDRARPEQGSPDEGVVKHDLPPVEEPLPSPSAEPSPQAEQPPVEQPPAEPSPDPSPTPPPPPPAPPWSFAVTTSTTSVEACSCPPDAELVGSQVQATGDGFIFSQTMRGGARDAAGDLTWPFSLHQWGEVSGAGGAMDFRVTLASGGGQHLYAGTTALAEISELEDGGAAYRFEGTFDLTNASQPVAGLPWRGFVSATILVWGDGKVYGGTLELTDATA